MFITFGMSGRAPGSLFVTFWKPFLLQCDIISYLGERERRRERGRERGRERDGPESQEAAGETRTKEDWPGLWKYH